MPPTVGAAIGFMISEPEPVLNKIGMSARIVVAVVMTIPSSTATPKRAIYPTQTAVLKLNPRKYWSHIPPTKAKGREKIMIRAAERS